jgi:putative membrane protein
MNHSFTQLLVRWALLAAGVVVATKLVPGIRCDDGATLIVVVLLLSFLNAVLKPLLVLFTLPFIVLTLGFGMIVINALLFLAVGKLVDGFHVAGFWSAVGGSIVVSVTNLVLSRLFRRPRVPGPSVSPAAPRPARGKPDDVIDI